MNRQEKEQVVASLKNDFQQSQASFLVGYKGMTVSQIVQLRRKLRNSGGTFKVAKVSLMKRIAHELPQAQGLTPYLKEQIALVFAGSESPAIAKILFEFADTNKQLNILAGCLESKVLTKDSVHYLATLPSREILLAKVCGTAKAPIAGFTNVLAALLRRLVIVLKLIEEQKKSAQNT